MKKKKESTWKPGQPFPANLVKFMYADSLEALQRHEEDELKKFYENEMLLMAHIIDMYRGEATQPVRYEYCWQIYKEHITKVKAGASSFRFSPTWFFGGEQEARQAFFHWLLQYERIEHLKELKKAS